MQPVSVLMLCMGNICRSPMAHAVFQHLIDEAGLGETIRVDSAGTHSYHLGHEPHPETQAELARRGIDVGNQVSRLVTPADLETFDYVIAMDHANVQELVSLARPAGGIDAVHARVALLLEFAEAVPGDATDEVPDPYYVGGYDRVFELVDAGCRGLFEHVLTDPR